MNYHYIIRYRENGCDIEGADSIEEAEQIIRDYEEQDEQDGIYSPRSYEIYDAVAEEVVY